MKKAVLIVLLSLFLLLLSVFFLIPNHLTVSKIVLVKANKSGVLRLLSDKNKCMQWWPDYKNDVSNNTSLSYNHFKYQFYKTFYSGIEVLIGKKQWEKSSFINLIPLGIDSVAVEWKCEVRTGFNPIKKLIVYEKAKDIKSNMIDILERLRSYAENNENIYGFSIKHTTLKDTVVVATKTITQGYPTTAVIYGLVDRLQAYIAREGAKGVNYPMLNVTQKDSNTYQTMVGIPTDRVLKESETIFNRRLVPITNKILTIEVKGGPASVKQGYNAIGTYMNDYQLSAPVIPFEYLVTDRSKETDTSKWITIIYYPII